MLHVVSGDEMLRAIAEAGVLRRLDPALRETRDPDAIAAWQDVLYEGPVRAGLSPINLANERARFIAAQGWAPYITARQGMGERDAMMARTGRQDEVVFWFEDDLYDVLQLAQALDRLAARRPVETAFSWVLLDSRSPLSRDAVAATLAIRQPVPDDAWPQARALWTAFTGGDPAALDRVRGDGTMSVDVLRDGLERLVAEFPGVGDGLSESERGVVGALAGGPLRPVAIFDAARNAERRPFLGDTQVWGRLHRFATAAEPLIRPTGGGEWVTPVEDMLSPEVPDMEAFHGQSLELTDAGRSVLAGQRDWLMHGGAGRWLGGYEITGPDCWRWDREASRLVPPVS